MTSPVMTNRETLRSLADTVEGLRGRDSAIEQEIAIALGWTHRVDRHDDDLTEDVWIDPKGKDHPWWPFVTASIDSAMSLVPAYCDWLRKDFDTMTVAIPAADEKQWARHIDGRGATPALALTAASLRAIGEGL